MTNKHITGLSKQGHAVDLRLVSTVLQSCIQQKLTLRLHIYDGNGLHVESSGISTLVAVLTNNATATVRSRHSEFRPRCLCSAVYQGHRYNLSSVTNRRIDDTSLIMRSEVSMRCVHTQQLLHNVGLERH